MRLSARKDRLSVVDVSWPMLSAKEEYSDMCHASENQMKISRQADTTKAAQAEIFYTDGVNRNHSSGSW